MGNWVKRFGWGFTIGLILVLGLGQAPVADPTDPGFRSLPPEGPSPDKALELAQSYCTSVGGSHTYESIASVSAVQTGQTMTITVNIWIANPTGCTAGSACPEYDNSPEYVNAWIDWDGDDVWESNERVMDVALTGYTGINYHGSMTAVSQVTIPPGASGTVWLRANLGWGYDPNNPCEYSWTWGDVEDRAVGVEGVELRVTEISISDNVAISQVSNPIWHQDYDAAGNTSASAVERPFADAIHSLNNFREFQLDIQLQAFQGSAPEGLETVCYWDIAGLYPGLGPGTSGIASFDGLHGMIELMVPSEVGKYRLVMEFTFRDGTNALSTQVIPLEEFYVILRGETSDAKGQIYLEKACSWGAGGTNDESVCDALVHGIYGKSGWLYRDNNVATRWVELVNNQAADGNCVDFTNVWVFLCRVLGVTGASPAPYQRGYNDIGFITTTPATALDGETGNAYPGGATSTARNRWLFGMHSVGARSPRYYDPTVGDIYSNDRQFIEWDNFGESGTGPGGETGTVFRKVGTLEYVLARSTIETTPEGWPIAVYLGPFTGSSEAVSTYGGKLLASLGGTPQVLSSASADGATFTGDYTVTVVDSDFDGVANTLRVEADVDVISAGLYVVFGSLQSDGSTITYRAGNKLVGPSAYELVADVGLHTVVLCFSGEDIHRAGVDGPYDINLSMLDGNSEEVDIARFATEAYSFAGFGELPVRIHSCSDSGIDTDANDLFDHLSVDVSLSATKAMNCRVGASLSTDSVVICDAEVVSSLVADANGVTLNFNGPDINNSQLAGPYRVTITVYGSDETPISTFECATAAYDYLDFEPQPGKLEGFFDQGTDTNGNGLFEFLTVGAFVRVDHVGDYRVRGWLSNGDGNEIAAATSTINLNAGSNVVPLEFDGPTLFQNGSDGPYILNFICLEQDDGTVVDDGHGVYATAAYSYLAFERPVAPLIALTGNYADHGTDTNGDGLYDFLTVDVEVTCADDGVAVASARLVAPDGEDIRWVSNYVTGVTAGVPITIPLHFDGRYIFGSLQDGPYRLLDLMAYHTGDPGQAAFAQEAHTAGAYAYEDFEPAAVICGTVRDHAAPVAGTLLTGTGGDYDHTNSEGFFNLVMLNSGSCLVEMEPPTWLEADTWLVYVNEELVGEGTSVAVAATVGQVTRVDFEAEAHWVGIDVLPWICPNTTPATIGNADVQSGEIVVEDAQSGSLPGATKSVPSVVTNTGYLTVALLGSEYLDVADIVPSSIRLEGLAPAQETDPAVSITLEPANLRDVATPVGKGSLECDCNSLGPDGYDDLVIRFSKAALIVALGEIDYDQAIPLTLSGELNDGTLFTGIDCIVLLEDKKNAAETADVSLSSNYPNPFNPTTVIRFRLPDRSDVKLDIFNVMGQKVTTLIDGEMEAGEHFIRWDGSDLASGVYFYRLDAGDGSAIRKMMLLK